MVKEVKIPHRHGKKPIAGFVVEEKESPPWQGAWYKDIKDAVIFDWYSSNRKIGGNYIKP